MHQSLVLLESMCYLAIVILTPLSYEILENPHKVLKHKSVTQVDFVELDEDVINVCKKHFPWGKIWSNDPRVSLHITDGATFVRNAPTGMYDVIIQDSADPFYMDDTGERVVLPSEVLYAPEHFENLYRIQSANGVFTFQSETYNIPSSLEGIRTWRKVALDAGFETAKYGTIAISTYPTGQIGLFLCTKKKKETDMESVQERFNNFVTRTTYYHPRLQER